MRTPILYLLVLAPLLLLPLATNAQTYEIDRYVIASGGGSGSTGSSGGRTFTVDGTIGQNIAGTTSAGIGGGGYSIMHGGFWAADFLAPTAALVSISGRVLSLPGQPVFPARVMLTAPDGSMRSAATNTFGFYSISGLEAGHTYILTARAKGSAFVPRVVTLNADLTDVDLTAVNGSDERGGQTR